MKNTAMEQRISDEIRSFIDSRRSLQLATLGENGYPYASYAPFARDDSSFYVLLSDIAVHGVNLSQEPRASVLIIEDEDPAGELYARVRVAYQVDAQKLNLESEDGKSAIEHLVARHGERPGHLAQLADFHLFRLTPTRGRYVKGFGKAYELRGESLLEVSIDHLRIGHTPRADAAA
ncbi:MAG: pyridoxamine 5'-phosphate oxidase family protein [Congregibacter sp.]|nr:pyridoxamine 5'-phosphate oxidase family protein [Congregibacter sp.]